MRANATRRHLDAGQKAAIWVAFRRLSEEWRAARKEAHAAANKARSEATRAQPRAAGKLAERPAGPVQRCTGPEDKRERVKLAADAGVSPRTMAAALSLHGKSPVLFEQVKPASCRLRRRRAKLAARRALAAELRAKPAPTPQGPFDVLVIDPPWAYSKRAEDATHRGRCQYPDMTIEEIAALPVARLASPSAIVWLWTTNAFMREAYALLDAWGFESKTILTWAKDRIGVGDWLRGQTEHCHLAVRGKPIVDLRGQSTLLHAPLREHSRKPDEFFALVDALCPGSKLELFSREARVGWAAAGGEKDFFDRVR